MGIISIGRPSDDMSLEDLADLIAKTNKMVEHLVNGRIDSKNVFEVGGWRVTLEQMSSKDGDVGFSTEDTGADDIRIWAGDAKDGVPKFVVTKSGILTAIDGDFAGKITADEGLIGGFAITSTTLTAVSGGTIQNQASPSNKVYLDSTGFHANDASGVERLTIGTTPAEGAKALIGRDASGAEQSIYTYDTETTTEGTFTGQYITAHGAYLLLSADGDVRLISSAGHGFRSVSGTPEINDGFGWSTIAKKTAVDSLSSTVSSNTSRISSLEARVSALESAGP